MSAALVPAFDASTSPLKTSKEATEVKGKKKEERRKKEKKEVCGERLQ